MTLMPEPRERRSPWRERPRPYAQATMAREAERFDRAMATASEVNARAMSEMDNAAKLAVRVVVTGFAQPMLDALFIVTHRGKQPKAIRRARKQARIRERRRIRQERISAQLSYRARTPALH